MGSKHKLVLAISTLASFVAFLDGTIVNVALPAIARDLGGGLVTQQWVVDAYLITLGALILIAGSLSDLFGRKKVLMVGLIGFGAASVLCALAPSAEFLIAMRALQGIAGALLVPSSLALIISEFEGAGEGKAIGTWTAWTGISTITGPLLGGWLVDAGSWRSIFLINVVPIAITLWLLGRLRAPHTSTVRPKVDITGAVLCIIGLGLSVCALIEQPHLGWQNPAIYLSFVVGVISFVLFLHHEAHSKQPMLPLSLFAVRNFSFGNVATFAVYAGLSVAAFLVTLFLQQVGGYTALQAGLSLLPITLVMFGLSSRFGALASKYGPRLFMTLGPLLGGIGFLLMTTVQLPVAYLTQVLPGVLLFGIGLSMTVAPLTSAVLGSIHSSHAGAGSAVNNAVARIAGLLAVAALGSVLGVTLTLDTFKRGLLFVVCLLVLGGLISWIGIRNSPRK